MALAPQFVAAAGRAPVLPDDGVGHRLPRGAVPQQRGLALVGDADGRDVAGHGLAAARLLQGFQRHGVLRGPDLAGIVFDPARTREDLGELALGEGDNLAGAVEHDGARAGRALVEGEDVFHGALL